MRFQRSILFVLPTFVLATGLSCREPPRSDPAGKKVLATATASGPLSPTPTLSPPPASQPSVVNTVDANGQAVLRLPERLDQDPACFPAGWLVIEKLFKSGSAAAANGTVTMGARTRLTVTTRNVETLRLQLNDLSLSRSVSPGKALDLDGQAFEITTKSGPLLRFERKATTGAWKQIIDSPKK